MSQRATMGDPADTVPPPPGEDDAYSAATRVEAMPTELLALARDNREPGAPNRPPDAAPKVPAEPKRPTPPGPASARASVPRLDDVPDISSGDDSTEPTLDKPVRFILQAAAKREAAEAAKAAEDEQTVARAPEATTAIADAEGARRAEDDERAALARLAGKRAFPAWALVVIVVLAVAAAWLALAR